MQYMTTRDVSSINDTKLHKMNSSEVFWRQPFNSIPNPMYSSNSSSEITDDNTYNTYDSQHHKHSLIVEKNTGGKPPYSYATLIKYAIERSIDNKLTLSQIYQWVIDHYPYYGTAGSGWKNSIRHNLSLNKSFVRVPRPVNEPGKGSYWTVDHFVSENEHKTKTRKRAGRSISDSSIHRPSHCNWAARANKNLYDGGRSLSNDTDASDTDMRRSSQFSCISHSYSGFTRTLNNGHPYGYPNYHYQQRIPSHETFLSARQHSSVTYSLPTSATTTNHHPSFSGFTNNSMYSMHQQPFYSHRQSCPDLTSICSSTYSETNMPPHFNTTSSAGNGACLDSAPCDNKTMYTNPQAFPGYNGAQHNPYSSIKGNARTIDSPSSVSSSFYKQDTLPSPVLSSSNSPSSTSQHLSVADQLTVVAQHPSPVTTTPTPGDSLTSPYRLINQHNDNGPVETPTKEECITSPPSPYIMSASLNYSVSQRNHKQQQNSNSPSSQKIKIESPPQLFPHEEHVIGNQEGFDYSNL